MTISEALASKRILVLEDEPFIAMDIEQVLLGAGAARIDLFFKVCDEINGALTAIDAAVLDLNVGGESSIPMARMLATANIPFVFVSGHSADVLEGDMLGRPFLSKPINPASLVNTIGSFWSDESVSR